MNRVLNEETGIFNRLAGRDGHLRTDRSLPIRRCTCVWRMLFVAVAMTAAIQMTSGGRDRAMAEDGASSGAPPTKAAETEASEHSSPKLPYGFTPPAELPAGASSDEEWVVKFGDGSKRDLDQARRDFISVFTRGNFQSPADRANFDKYVQWRLSQFTHREFLTVNDKQQEIRDMRKKWLFDVGRARSAGPAVLNAYLEALVRETPNLFKYHFVARLNGAWMLAELNETEAQNGNPAVPYLPAAKPLLDLLGQQQQLEAVRVPAVRGLARMIRDGQPSDKLRNDIISAFVNELQNGDPKHDILPATIAEELGKLEIVNGSDRTPVVVNVLTQVLADKRRGFRSRCEAATALGRLPLDNSINVSLIAYEIAALAQDMAQAFQEDANVRGKNGLKPNYAAWKRCFANLYFAFRGDTHKNIQRKHGLSNKNELNAGIKRSINGAYNQVLPLVLAMLTEKPFDQQHLNNIQQWLQANVPQSRKVHDSFQEIISSDHSREPVELSTTTSDNLKSE